MFATIVVVFVVLRLQALAQEQALSTGTPPLSQQIPFLDLFTSASNAFPDPIRKAYDHDYYVTCPKSDTLSSFANILGSAAKIMLSAAVIAVLKLLAGKLILLPVLFVFIIKIGLKVFFLWPMISKLMKYFKTKKKNGHRSRIITDCSQRIACVINKLSRSTWATNIGAAITFFLIEDIEEDSSLAKSMLTVLTNNKIADCMSLECSSGIDIS